MKHAGIKRKRSIPLFDLLNELGRCCPDPLTRTHSHKHFAAMLGSITTIMSLDRTVAADAPCPSAATLPARDSGPRRLLKTTSWPVARASRANAVPPYRRRSFGDSPEMATDAGIKRATASLARDYGEIREPKDPRRMVAAASSSSLGITQSRSN